MVFKNRLAGRHGIIAEKDSPRPGLRYQMKVLIAVSCVFTVGRLVESWKIGICMLREVSRV